MPLTECQLGWYHKILTGVEKSILLGESSPSFGNFVDLTTDQWERPGAGNAKRKTHITTNTLMELRKVGLALSPVDAFSNFSVLNSPLPSGRCNP